MFESRKTTGVCSEGENEPALDATRFVGDVPKEKRFDIERMMRDIERTTEKPKDFDKYRTIGESPSTGIFPEWCEKSKVLGSMCNWLIKVAGYYLHEASSIDEKKRCLDIMGDFVDRYDKKLPNSPKIYPWGCNWYQFSVSSSNMLFYYMLCVRNVQDKQDKLSQAINLLFRIVKTPMKSLGMTRDQANSVYMGLPWIVAHYLKGDVDEASQCPDYEYVVKYTHLLKERVKEQKKEGLYIDYTYITHTDCLAYGYLAEMTRMSKPIVSFDNHMYNFVTDWERCQRILLHPTLEYGPIGFFSKDRRLKSGPNADSSMGIRVIPTCLFLRMYGDNYSFAMRGQNKWIAYYESDQTFNDMSQYWVQYRGVRFAKQKCHKSHFPDIGFFFAATDICGKPIDTFCCIPTGENVSTTETFKPGPWEGKNPIPSGFVFAYGHIGMLRHFYNCKEMVYNFDVNERYGGFIVDEFVLCDYHEHTIHTWARIYKKMQYDMKLVAADKCHYWPAGQSDTEQGIFHMAWDCKKETCTSKFETHQFSSDVIAEYYPPGIKVVSTDNTVMLLEKDKPKLAMYPETYTNLCTEFQTTYNDEKFTFVFNKHTNQYTVKC